MFNMTQGLFKTKKRLITSTLTSLTQGSRINEMLHETIRNDNFWSNTALKHCLRHCFKWLQHCSSIATLCCAKNRRCELSRVTSP